MLQTHFCRADYRLGFFHFHLCYYFRLTSFIYVAHRAHWDHSIGLYWWSIPVQRVIMNEIKNVQFFHSNRNFRFSTSGWPSFYRIAQLVRLLPCFRCIPRLFHDDSTLVHWTKFFINSHMSKFFVSQRNFRLTQFFYRPLGYVSTTKVFFCRSLAS